MPSFALHRFSYPGDFTPFILKRGKKRYTLRYVDTDKAWAKKMADLARMKYGYGAIIAKVTLTNPKQHGWAPEQKVAWGVYVRKGGRP